MSYPYATIRKGPYSVYSPPMVHGPSGYGAYGAASSQPCLRKGAKGAAVTLLQTLLRGVGFNKDGSRTPADGDWKGAPYRRTYPIGTLATDADFGGATDKALRAFQTAEAITSDGIAGPTTWSRLGETGLPCTSGSASGGSGGSGGSGPASKTYVSPSGEILPTGFETPFYQQKWFYWSAGLGGAAIIAALLWPKGKK
jgi:peptidoglycan hydrolase-like protein with peptidoglycan-binding domain